MSKDSKPEDHLITIDFLNPENPPRKIDNVDELVEAMIRKAVNLAEHCKSALVRHK